MLRLHLLAAAAFFGFTAGQNVLTTSGFTNCIGNPTIRVNHANITFNKDNATVLFDVSGTSLEVQKVKASLVVTTYGRQVFERSFDPCDNSTYVQQLCPVPKGTFTAAGSQLTPSNYLSQVPSIAFSIPDIDANAQLNITSLQTGEQVACVSSQITNGKSIQLPAISAVSGAILGASLLFTAVNTGYVGSSAPMPTFSTVLFWFHSVAQAGLLSVDYPPVYQSFTRNFGFSTGLISFNSFRMSIDKFRSATGGNVSSDSTQSSQNAGSFADVQQNVTDSLRRNILTLRDALTSANSDPSNTTSSGSQNFVSGISHYVEMLSIPQANTFMTVLLIFGIVAAAIIVGILGFKLILEIWALLTTFPKRLTGFRKQYWRMIANTLATLIFLLYGIWTIWCIFQWTNGDSWAAKTLAAVTWACFTAVLLFYTVKIFMKAHQYRRRSGNAYGLYEDEETWKKYSFMYDSYRKGYWWIFVPAIVYMFAKGVVIAVGNGHGMVQTVAQLVIESLMFAFLLFTRPFATRGSNWINGVIQFVRVLSIACILVFVEQLGISQTTKTVTGVALIAIQVSLTAVLGILLAANAIRTCFRTNPHSKRIKEARKLSELEKNSPLPLPSPSPFSPSFDSSKEVSVGVGSGRGDSYHPEPTVPTLPPQELQGSTFYRQERPRFEYGHGRSSSSANLVAGAAPMGSYGIYRNHGMF